MLLSGLWWYVLLMWEELVQLRTQMWNVAGDFRLLLSLQPETF